MDGAGDATTCAPASGSVFPVGATTISCSATDARGNQSVATLVVTVTDVAPVVTTSGNVTVEAAGPGGAVATFTASATDVVDGTDVATCIPLSGSLFPLGTTAVTCTAVDAHGQIGSALLTVTVRDTTRPVVTTSASVTTPATSPAGAPATFNASAIVSSACRWRRTGGQALMPVPR